MSVKSKQPQFASALIRVHPWLKKRCAALCVLGVSALKRYGGNTPCRSPVLERIVAAMACQSVHPCNGKVLKTLKELKLTDNRLKKAIKTPMKADLRKPAPATP